MKCQLHELPDAGSNLTRVELGLLRARQLMHYAVRVSRKIVADPRVIHRKLKRQLSRTPEAEGTSRPQGCTTSAVLGLQPGERVRVKSLEQILTTLDENYTYEGMAFMFEEMKPYCDGVYAVRKRVERFFDERNRQLRKPRNVVILDEVVCEPPTNSEAPYAGCARTCYLFWKEAWLERVDTDA